MTARGGGTYPYRITHGITEHGAAGSTDLPPRNPSESRNGGSVTYRPWKRNETLVRKVRPPTIDVIHFCMNPSISA
jgi:hypothetical protein